MFKVAVPTRNNVVDEHFGHCEAYTIFTVDYNKNIVNSELMYAPQGCGCKSNIAEILKNTGVTVMLAANMGGGALNILNAHNIEVYRGCSGDVNQLINSFLEGQIADSGIGCHQHEQHSDGHSCHNHN